MEYGNVFKMAWGLRDPEMEAPLDGLVVEYLDPITVRVLDECQLLHFPVFHPLNEWHSQLIEALTRCCNIRHHDSDVAEPARV